ncbi:Cytidine deaminase [Mycena indigotica]|uniref:cytidine deaminase n=1 Tax=Mycena indigotica TaxID=2126181 RepID=A0A8H6S0U3_9AGAR|nr:Cytidine deaminase [Mycena indigotica]KAF7290533.1 Cytidine deaminase [Mycena indigotica]
MSTRLWTLSVEQRESLIEAAFEGKSKNHTYSPYSKFPVGAALLAANGTIFKGANIENASYGSYLPNPPTIAYSKQTGGTICAERTAFVKAVSEGTRSFIALAVVTNVHSSISPCGICRQFIREFCTQDMPILLIPGNYLTTKDFSSVKETSIGELLPDSFGPEHLELPRD